MLMFIALSSHYEFIFPKSYCNEKRSFFKFGILFLANCNLVNWKVIYKSIVFAELKFF